MTDWDHDGHLDILIGDAQRETVPPEVSDTADHLKKVRDEAARVLSDYRRLRRLKNSLVQETQETERTFVERTREKYAQRLQELRETISELEKAMQPRQESHGYVWLLRRTNTPR